jgi:hypothetical protein
MQLEKFDYGKLERSINVLEDVLKVLEAIPLPIGQK